MGISMKWDRVKSWERVPLSRDGFKARVADVYKNFPGLVETGGVRNPKRNKESGGDEFSAHLDTIDMGADSVSTKQEMWAALAYAQGLGMWGKVHKALKPDGTWGKLHLHLQGKAPGWEPTPEWHAANPIKPKQPTGQVVAGKP